MAHGTAEVVRDRAEHAALVRTGPRSWISEREPVFVRLTAELLTGHRLHPPGDPAPHGHAPHNQGHPTVG